MQSTNEELQSVNEELYTVNSELQEKNRELQFLNNDFTNLLNSTDIGTLFLDTKLRIRKSTPALNRHFNLQEEDIGRPISSFAANFTEAIRISIINHTREALEKLISVEKEILDNDGNYYLVKINPFITSDNHIDGVVISFINIHQLKAVENKLAASEIKYRQLFEKLNEGFMHARIITNEEGKPVDWEYITINPAFEHQTGLKMKEVVGKRKLDINPEVKDEPIDWIELYGETALTGKEQFIQSYSAPEDKYYYVHVFCPEQGEFAATFSDITEHKMAEEELRKTDIMYRGVIENAPDGIIMISYEGKFKFASTSALRMFGYTQDNLYNKDPNALTHPDDLPMVLDVLEKITKNENHKPQTLEYRFKNRKGDWHWIESTFSRSNNENGNPAIVINFRDIQKRKEHEKQLIAAKKQAELANLHKNNFLANMSHEIRTPMNGVIGFSRLLRRDNLSEAEREQYLDIIDVNAKQLLNLIDDIIDVAKIEASELNIETRSCNLQQLLNDTKTMFEQLGQSLEKDHINIFLKIPEENVVPHIETDPARLQQVINNLLHNALKFTEEGKIEFGYRVKENELEFYVSDTGIGIPQDQKEHIFEQFQQVDSSHQSKYDGTGLGLAICKGLIDLLGGKIWVESELGQGATFRFTIPHHPVSIDKVSENTTEKNELSIDSNGTTILIVDDNDMVHHFYKALLKPYGTKIIDATTAEKAIELFSANPEIDMVLMDIRMPKMSGPEALAAILKINPDARVIAQTAYAYEADKSKYLEMGFVDYLTKPIDEDILIAAITKHRCSNR